MLRMEDILQEPRYWKRVLLVAWSYVLGHHMLREAISELWRGASELWRGVCKFALALFTTLLILVLPFTFWAAPLWLWLLERDEAKRQAEIGRWRREFLARTGDGNGEDE